MQENQDLDTKLDLVYGEIKGDIISFYDVSLQFSKIGIPFPFYRVDLDMVKCTISCYDIIFKERIPRIFGLYTFER